MDGAREGAIYDVDKCEYIAVFLNIIRNKWRCPGRLRSALPTVKFFFYPAYKSPTLQNYISLPLQCFYSTATPLQCRCLGRGAERSCEVRSCCRRTFLVKFTMADQMDSLRSHSQPESKYRGHSCFYFYTSFCFIFFSFEYRTILEPLLMQYSEYNRHYIQECKSS